jgi:hypothetical protein
MRPKRVGSIRALNLQRSQKTRPPRAPLGRAEQKDDLTRTSTKIGAPPNTVPLCWTASSAHAEGGSTEDGAMDCDSADDGLPFGFRRHSRAAAPVTGASSPCYGGVRTSSVAEVASDFAAARLPSSPKQNSGCGAQLHLSFCLGEPWGARRTFTFCARPRSGAPLQSRFCLVRNQHLPLWPESCDLSMWIPSGGGECRATDGDRHPRAAAAVSGE